jgi:hypothetical protein
MSRRVSVIVVVLLLAVGAALISNHAPVAQAQTNFVWSQYGTVTNYQIGTTALGVITSAPFAANGCTLTDMYEADSSNSPDYAALQSVILGAVLSGKKVSIGIQGCAASRRPNITSIQIQP